MASLNQQRSPSNFVYPRPRSMDAQNMWLSIVKDKLKEEPGSESETEVSIFIVPKTLLANSPNCYTPQHIALGPNHYWRPELHDMEGYKTAAAKRFQQQLQLQGLNFEGLVKQFTEKHEAAIRSCYQRFIYFKKEDLVWVMAVDSAFLLELLQRICSRQDGKKPKEAETTSNNAPASVAVELASLEVPKEANTLPTFTHVYSNDLYGRTSSVRNAIVRDMVMLENQIPLFLLREMLKYRFSTSEESANDMLYEMLKAFRKKFCPFKSLKDLAKGAVSRRVHLLDYVYRTILPLDEPTSDDGCEIEDQSDIKNIQSFKNPSAITGLLSQITQVLSTSNDKISDSVTKGIDFAVGFISQLKGEGSSKGLNGVTKRPPEIAIPSATELARAGVLFSPIKSAKKDDNKFANIRFDAKKATFYLPTIKLDDNTEVILRNLVAYEATRHHSLYFTRYTELMNGIIDTAEDVRLLKKSNIIENHLKSDEEAANMWNGMSRSIKKKKVINLDEHIDNVNKFYNSRFKMKFKRFMRHYVYESWRFLTFMAAILLLLLQISEFLCSIYKCNKLFHFK